MNLTFLICRTTQIILFVLVLSQNRKKIRMKHWRANLSAASDYAHRRYEYEIRISQLILYLFNQQKVRITL